MAACKSPRAKAWATGAPTAWANLGLAPPKAQLYCGYLVVAGAPGSLTNAGARGLTWFNNVAPQTAWWYALATCDNDGNTGTNAIYLTSSDRDTVYDENITR